MASIYPLPQNSSLQNNFTSVVNRDVGSNAYTFRFDHEFSERDKFFARYSFEDFRLDAPQGQASCCLPTPDFAASKFELGPFVAGIQNTTLRTQGLALNHTHTFSPTLLLELRAGFARTNPKTVQSDFGRNAATSLGIQGINISLLRQGASGADLYFHASGRDFQEVEANARYGMEMNYRYSRAQAALPGLTTYGARGATIVILTIVIFKNRARKSATSFSWPIFM